MSKQEEIYPEGYPRQTDSFSEAQKFKLDVFEVIREIALETTIKAFEKLGYKKEEGRAGEYATGDSYGYGTSLDHFNIRLTSRPNTNTFFQKIIYFGGKEMLVDVTIGWNAKNKTIELIYQTSEAMAFRGYGSKAGAQLINNKMNFVINSIPAFKKELKTAFSSFAEKEVSHITSTKIGIEDKTNKSINSMVETSMKKFSIKDLMTSSNEELSSTIDSYINEGEKKETDSNVKRFDPQVIAANSPDKLLFDNLDELEDGDFKTSAKNKLKKFGVVAVNELKPSEKKTYFEELQKELEIKEITASGGNAAGAAFTGPMCFKKGGDLNLEEKSDDQTEKFNKTPYAQSKKQKPTVHKAMKEGDSFWTTVELNPGSGYVPKGMEKNFVMGQHDKNLNESIEKFNTKSTDASLIKESLIKKKFASLEENTKKGINKRYIITEERTEDEQANRWKKLVSFVTNETIHRAENVIEENEVPIVKDNSKILAEQAQKKAEKAFALRESENEIDGIIDGRNVIMVPKPNSLSNAMFKVFKDDYLNENRAYIKDLNSGNLVSNPNYKFKK